MSPDAGIAIEKQLAEDRELITNIFDESHVGYMTGRKVDQIWRYLWLDPIHDSSHKVASTAVCDERNDRDHQVEELGPVGTRGICVHSAEWSHSNWLALFARSANAEFVENAVFDCVDKANRATVELFRAVEEGIERPQSLENVWVVKSIYIFEDDDVPASDIKEINNFV